MVGTSSTSVTFSSWMAFSTASGVKARIIRFDPPESSSETIAAPFARWNIGAACR